MIAAVGLSNAAETTSTEKAVTEKKVTAEKKTTEKKAAAEKKTTGKKVATEKKTEEIPGAINGKVVDTMDSAGYTYVEIEKAGKKTWVAIPQTKITKGTTMTFRPGMEMKNFESKTLKRKFDSIVFSDGVVK